MTVTFGLEKPINGESPDVDELITNHSFILSNMLAYGIDGATTTNQDNALFENLSGTTQIDETVTTSYYDQTNNIYLFSQTFDDFADGSIDTTKFTPSVTGSGTVVESESNIKLECEAGDSATLITNGSEGFDALESSGNSEWAMDVIKDSGDGGSNHKIQVSNGSTHIDLVSGNSTFTRRLYRVVFNRSGSSCVLFTNEVAGGEVDISTLGKWYLRWNVDNSSGATNRMRVYHTSLARSGSVGSQDLVTATQTSKTTSDVAIANVRMTVGTANLSGTAVAVSFDNGLNYSSGSTGVLIRNSTAGTEVKSKFTVDFATTITASQRNIPSISDYGVYYG